MENSLFSIVFSSSRSDRLSVHRERSRAKWVVRWREDGKQRARRFTSEADARAFDTIANPSGRTSRDAAAAHRQDATRVDVAMLKAERRREQGPNGVYPYATRQGVRWRAHYGRAEGGVLVAGEAVAGPRAAGPAGGAGEGASAITGGGWRLVRCAVAPGGDGAAPR